MKNVADYKTAEMLFHAGFPQPKKEVGQFWWVRIFEGGTAETDVLCVVCAQLNMLESPVLFPVALQSSSFLPLKMTNDQRATFAPFASDICAAIAPHIQTAISSDGTWKAGQLRWNGFDADFTDCETEVEAAAKTYMKYYHEAQDPSYPDYTEIMLDQAAAAAPSEYDPS